MKVEVISPPPETDWLAVAIMPCVLFLLGIIASIIGWVFNNRNLRASEERARRREAAEEKERLRRQHSQDVLALLVEIQKNLVRMTYLGQEYHAVTLRLWRNLSLCGRLEKDLGNPVHAKMYREARERIEQEQEEQKVINRQLQAISVDLNASKLMLEVLLGEEKPRELIGAITAFLASGHTLNELEKPAFFARAAEIYPILKSVGRPHAKEFRAAIE